MITSESRPQLLSTDGGAPRRIASLDAARGYAAGIMVFGPLFASLRVFDDIPLAHAFRLHMTTHAKWNGIRYFDFGFPAYLLIMGIAIVFSLTRRLNVPNKSDVYIQLVKRSLVLIILGFLLNGGFRDEWPQVRLVGVLQRIAVCYCFASFVFLNLGLRSQIVLFCGVELGYWAILAWAPTSLGSGDFTQEGNLVAYFDQHYLPGRKVFGHWDPEGLLSTIGAFASCLAGVLTGQFLRLSKASSQQIVFRLFLAALAAAAVGLLWAEWLPFNKKMWTPSFVLISAAKTLGTFGIFYQIADVWQKPGWLFPLVVVGVNTLVAFIAVQIVPFHELAVRLVGGDIESSLGRFGPLLVGLTEGMLGWLLLYWLYRRGIVLKA